MRATNQPEALPNFSTDILYDGLTATSTHGRQFDQGTVG